MHVLIADDNPDDVLLLQEGFRAVSRTDFSFTQTTDGCAALEEWRDRPPGFFSHVILDYYLPKRTAVEILTAMPIHRPIGKHEKIVVLTAHLPPEERVRLMGLGAALVQEKAAGLDGVFELTRAILAL